ncbi:DUF4811 domain-containing protein [Furfurilactobacillus sp. WILCCON 0119]|uniref:DUF4811 domain-containing protein n=1 Tax=Furfurilactobacillus entadae TaxID=2922307 RepID=UPI0035E7EB0B
MILATLVIGAIALFVCFVYIKPMTWRLIGTFIAMIILVFSLTMITQNDRDHYGMHKVTTSTTKTIYSADPSGKMNMVLYQKIGTKGKEDTQIYSTKKGQKKPGHTQVNEYTTNKVKTTTSTTATMKTTVTKWRYKDDRAKLWFGISGNDGKLVKRVNTFYLPQSWLHLSTAQVKQLKAEMAKMQTPAAKAQMKEQGAAYVKAQMQAAIAKDPSIATDQAKQAALSKQYAADFQNNLIKQAVAQLK